MLGTYPTNLKLPLNPHARRKFLYLGQYNSIFLSCLFILQVQPLKD